MSSSSRSSGGMGLSGVLAVVFIVLKLVGVIDWSWVWVLCPIWINLIIVVAIVSGIIIYDKVSDRKYEKSRKIK